MRDAAIKYDRKRSGKNLRPKLAWRPPADLVVRLTSWAEARSLDRSAALTAIVDAALERGELEEEIPPSLASDLFEELHVLLVAQERCQRDVDVASSAIDLLGVQTRTVSRLLAYWIAKTPGVRQLYETEEQAEERLLLRMDEMADEDWDVCRVDDPPPVVERSREQAREERGPDVIAAAIEDQKRRAAMRGSLGDGASLPIELRRRVDALAQARGCDARLVHAALLEVALAVAENRGVPVWAATDMRDAVASIAEGVAATTAAVERMQRKLDVVGPAFIGVPALLLHWCAQDPAVLNACREASGWREPLDHDGVAILLKETFWSEGEADWDALLETLRHPGEGE